MGVVVRQLVVAHGGYAYGAMEGDLHVLGRDGPTYRLSPLDGGRAPVAVPHRWPDGPVAALWLHDPDPARTGAAVAVIAGELAGAGWAVLDARLASAGPDAQPAPIGAAGVLIVVDGADDWPLPEFTWLLSNAVLRRSPARLLLTARDLERLPAFRAALTGLEAEVGTVAMP